MAFLVGARGDTRLNADSVEEISGLIGSDTISAGAATAPDYMKHGLHVTDGALGATRIAG